MEDSQFTVRGGKKTRQNRRENDDHISVLPADVMSHILSSLPTVDAVRTSVLSKDWKYKWTSISSIDIDDCKGLQWQSPRDGEATFIDLLTKIIMNVENIKSIRLRLFNKYEKRVVKLWVSALLSNPIEGLHVDSLFSPTKIVIHGNRLLNNTSVRDMTLMGPMFKVSANSSFVNLKRLFLLRVALSTETGFDTLSLTLPVLETFEVSICEWSNLKFMEIYAPVLISFKSETMEYFTEMDHYTISVHGDQLAEFISKGGEQENIYVTGSRVVRAHFCNNIRSDEQVQRSGSRVRSLLNKFAPTLDNLMLSLSVAEAILKSKQGVPIKSCEKLRRLVLHNLDHIVCKVEPETLFELLHATPRLQYLSIEALAWSESEFDYDAIEFVPSCIASSLEVIEIRNLVYLPSLCHSRRILRIAEFVLKTALKLKEVHLYPRYPWEKSMDKIVGEISKLPTCSKCVRFVGHEKPMGSGANLMGSRWVGHRVNLAQQVNFFENYPDEFAS